MKEYIIGDENAVNFIKVIVKEFKGQQYIDIRTMWNNNGSVVFTKKGISLSIPKSIKLVNILSEILNEMNVDEKEIEDGDFE